MMRIATNFQCLTVLKSRYSTVRYYSEVFVSRLSFYLKPEEFRQLFSPYGEIKEAKLIMDTKVGRTKGFGFIKYETEAEAQNAIKAMNGKCGASNHIVVCNNRRIERIIQGRLLFVEPAKKAVGNDACSKS